MKNNKGITLLALIITIIVLVILAGVALATLTGNTSIIDNANNAVARYNASANEDKNVLNQVEDLFSKYMGENNDDDDDSPALPKVDANGLALEPYTVEADVTNNVQIVIPAGFAPVILNGSNSTTSEPGEDGSVKAIMPVAQWGNITAAQINSGIVVVDHAITYDNGQEIGTVPDFNEYVWVPIPSSTDFARIAWTTRQGYTESGSWGDGGSTGRTHILEYTTSGDKTNKFWDDMAAIEYINMLNSVNLNKGFYVSRYEASNNGNNVAQSKKSQFVWNSIPFPTAVTGSSSNPTKNTHLIYGIEWDSILKWLIGHATIPSVTVGQTKTMELSDIQDNSWSWGNYRDSTGDAAAGRNGIRTTGYSEYWKANNIYDLAGNVWEWTQENYSTNKRTVRGGDYNYIGTHIPSAVRYAELESNVDSIERLPL